MCVKRSYAIVRARQANVKVRGTTKIDVDEWLYGQGGEKSELRRNRNSTGTKVSVHLCVSQKKIDGWRRKCARRLLLCRPLFGVSCGIVWLCALGARMMRRYIRQDIVCILECRQTTPDGNIAFRTERVTSSRVAFIAVAVAVVVVTERRLNDSRGRVRNRERCNGKRGRLGRGRSLPLEMFVGNLCIIRDELWGDAAEDEDSRATEQDMLQVWNTRQRRKHGEDSDCMSPEQFFAGPGAVYQ